MMGKQLGSGPLIHIVSNRCRWRRMCWKSTLHLLSQWNFFQSQLGGRPVVASAPTGHGRWTIPPIPPISPISPIWIASAITDAMGKLWSGHELFACLISLGPFVVKLLKGRRWGKEMREGDEGRRWEPGNKQRCSREEAALDVRKKLCCGRTQKNPDTPAHYLLTLSDQFDRSRRRDRRMESSSSSSSSRSTWVWLRFDRGSIKVGYGSLSVSS